MSTTPPTWATLPEPDFYSTYVDTNPVPPNTPFDAPTFLTWTHYLSETSPLFLGEGGPLPATLIFSILLGLRRADLAARYFSHLFAAKPPFAITHMLSGWRKALYGDIREALAILVPFVGLPFCIPALLGVSGVIAREGPTGADIVAAVPRVRPAVVGEGEDIAALGNRMSSSVYRGVGNAAVAQMLKAYFPDVAAATGNVFFGYLMGGAAERYFEREVHAELVLTAGMLGMGAWRQARSHVKACIGMGAPAGVVAALVSVAREITEWNGGRWEEVDVDALRDEVRANLEKGVVGEAFE